MPINLTTNPTVPTYQPHNSDAVRYPAILLCCSPSCLAARFLSYLHSRHPWPVCQSRRPFPSGCLVSPLIVIVQGLPAFCLGMVMPFLIYETPREATWLTATEHSALSIALARRCSQSYSLSFANLHVSLTHLEHATASTLVGPKCSKRLHVLPQPAVHAPSSHRAYQAARMLLPQPSLLPFSTHHGAPGQSSHRSARAQPSLARALEENARLASM